MLLDSGKTRHYVYGDQDEDRPNLYYCTYCDSFEPANHFEDQEHISNRVQSYTQSFQSWNRRPKENRMNVYRPDDAENIVANKVAEDIKAEKAARSQFYRWLLRQTKRDDPIGDLANDVERDRQFPRTVTSLDLLRSYLLHKNASPEAILAFDEACSEFGAKGKARIGVPLAQRFEIFKRDSYRCCICGASAADGIKLEVDHKIAIANNGTNDSANLWTLCFDCNRGKGVQSL
jgi:uncharacterized protein YozE (UPF0346 family)